MNIFLYYLDKWTAWLDFSWLITRPPKNAINNSEWPNDEPPGYLSDPLLK
jgi:hypothetical protein